MTAAALHTLDARQRADVQAALSAIEVAATPVQAVDFPALGDPALREVLEAALSETGRVLLRVGGGYLSGYDDTIANRLAAEGLGVLAPAERAVLALVLLRTVGVPRARGRLAGGDRTDAEPTTIVELAKHRHLSQQAIRGAVRRLRTAGILKPGPRPLLVPGPQLLRLTETRTTRLWEDLILLCRPDGMYAEVVRRRRAAAGQGGTR